MQKSPVCVDASIVIKIVSPEEMRPLAVRLWQSWLDQDREIVAPHLFDYEVTSALLRKAIRGALSLDEARGALRAALGMNVALLDPPGLSEQALELAVRFSRPAAYDAHYLALAEYLRCPFWTADERLYNATRSDFPYIQWLGDYRPEP
jgi:predicted nucleic acid-binding protein